MAFCTKEDVKTFLKIADTDKDAQIIALIPSAQGLIEEYCNRKFEQEEGIEYFNGGQDRLFLKRYPVETGDEYIDPPVIYEDGNREFEEDSLVDASDYYVDEENGIICFDYELEKTYGGIKVIYTGGYETIPEAIKQVCIEMVARKLKIGSSGDIGLVSKGTPGGMSITFSQEDLLPENKSVLNSFRREMSE